MMLLIIGMNPLFNHRGTTILGYLSNGNAITLEACVYGIQAAMLLAAVVLWFSCFNVIMTTDKLIYIFGRILPTLSLLISMILRFVPRYRKQLRETADAQAQLGRGLKYGSWITRMRQGVRILSIVLTWSLEHAVETANSMKSRGYGVKGRTAYSQYQFCARDAGMLVWILVLSGYVLYGVWRGCFLWSCYPSVLAAFMNNYPGVVWHSWMWSVYAGYAILALLPLLADVGGYVVMLMKMKGDTAWNSIHQ
jgi:energy-coupling factor transport system permease protein